ncbi:MAG: tetratricopeptide repeat protein [Caldilineaceae bacterium]
MGDALVITRHSLALTPESQQQVDAVNLLQTLAESGPIDSAKKANALQNVLDAYHGDFLADFHLPDAPNFDEWVVTTREHIRRQVVAAYQKLGQYARSTGNVDDGIAVARRWLQVDALDEAAHALLIQQMIDKGSVREAASHYDDCVALLRAELDIAPSATLTALILEIRPTPLSVAQPIAKQPLVVPQLVPPVYHNLPAPHDQFFGRMAALQDIDERLEQPWCRLVTLVGQGGVGKTRLALTAARRRLDRYPDGVWLVELADIDADDDDLREAIAVEIATALDLRLSGSSKPVEQLLNHLQHKELLLVLDNFEHLLSGGVPLVLDLLQRCAKVQLIVTSREALRTRAEWIIALTGLGNGPDDGDGTPSDVVDLFVARRAQGRRENLPLDDLVYVRHICHLVEGLPLAIELAAALARSRPLSTLVDELRDGFDVLATSLRDVPPRHRSLQIVFDMSWGTLTPVLQTRLARLSVFRGGFTAAAAQQITDTDTPQLAELGEKSLLTHDMVTDRFALHPVVRAYAAAKLSAVEPSVAELVEAPPTPTVKKHIRYYLTLLAEHSDALQKESPQHAVAALEPDLENVRLAWQNGLALSVPKSWEPPGSSGNESEAEPVEAVEPMAELVEAADLLYAALASLSVYYQLRGLAHEAEGVMQNTVRTAMTRGAAGYPLATRAGLEQARFQNRLGRYRAAIETVETALRQAQQGADHWAEGMGHVLWGEALWRLGEYDAAKNKVKHAFSIAQEVDSTLLVGWCHHHLGVIDDLQGRFAEALAHLEQACAAWRAIENAQALSNSLNSRGLICYNKGDLVSAQQIMEQALTICNQLDNRYLQSILLNNLSIIATQQRDYLSAHHYLQHGLQVATANGDLAAQGYVRTNLGKNYRLLGKTELAVKSLEEGVQISESIGNRALTAMGLFYLAETKREQKEPQQADALYRQALNIACQDNLQHLAFEVLISMAEHLSKFNESEARQLGAQAITLAEALENPTFLARAMAIDSYLSVS